MVQILLAYCLPKEIVAVTIMLNKNTKLKVRSPDGDTNFFNIVAGVLQGDTLASHLFIIYLDNVLRTSMDLMKENGFTLKKKKKKQTLPTNWDYADDLALLVNTSTQAESSLLNLERAAGGIYLHVNADKTKYVCFN